MRKSPYESGFKRGINWDCSMLQTPLKLWTLSTRCGPWWTLPNFFQCRPLHHAPLRRKLESHRAWRAGRMPFGRRYCSESLWHWLDSILYIYLGGRKLNNFWSEPKTCERPKTRDMANLKTIWEFVTLWHAASAQAKLPCGGRIPPYLDVPLKPVCNSIDFEHVLSYH